MKTPNARKPCARAFSRACRKAAWANPPTSPGRYCFSPPARRTSIPGTCSTPTAAIRRGEMVSQTSSNATCPGRSAAHTQISLRNLRMLDCVCDALQTRDPACFKKAGSRISGATLARCTVSGTREDPMKNTKPPYRADHVGSLLRPAALKQARERRAKSEISADALRKIEDREIARIIKKQEDIGLQSITDGEFRRSWWHLDFLWGLDGVEKHVMDAGIAFAAVTTRNEGIKVTGKLGFSHHPMIDHFKFVAAHTGRTPKITIPAPSAIYGRPMATPIDKTVYPKLDKMFDDLGQAYRKAVRAFADAGCRYLQLDEVFIAMLCDPKYRQQMTDRGDDPKYLGGLYGDLINEAIADIPA